MDFQKLMNVASKNEQKSQKELSITKPGLSTKLAPPKKEVKSAKGVQSAAVKAFLEKREKEEKHKAAGEQLKKVELMRLRHEARHDRKAHAMASRTKDNLQVFSEETDGQTTTEAQEEPVVDLKHLFTKHDRRVPHLPSDKIPNMLSMMKERKKQRDLAREEARKAAAVEAAAAEADAVKSMRQKLDMETTESDFKHKKIFASSRAGSDEKLHSASSVVQSKPASVDRKSSESKGKVTKKKNHSPPMSFEQLMALAEEKQAEPAVDTQPNNVPKKVCAQQQQQRPMTQEEKERHRRRETKEYQHWLKHGGPPPPGSSGGGKSRHQQNAGKSHKAQRMTVGSSLSRNDAFDESESDAESDDTCYVPSQEVNAKKSYLHTASNRLKDGTDITRKHSPANSGKLFSNQSNSSQQSHEHLRPVSRGEFMFTKGKVKLGQGNEAGQNGKSRSVNDELIEKLMEERRRMADRGDAVPSLADMLQELLNKVRGETNSQESTPKNSVRSGARSSSSSSTQSKVSVSDRKVEPVKSGVSRSHSVAARGARPYATVNETVVDCVRDKSSSAKPAKPCDKRSMKSTWEEMYERAKSKHPNHDRDVARRASKRPTPSDDSSEDEDEVDDNMDDFIDDGSDVERTDYSHYIRELFGYDRRKYASEADDDVRGMESSYSQQLKEDAVSTKLGLLEDLEDMRREEEEKLRKLGKLKAKKPRLK